MWWWAYWWASQSKRGAPVDMTDEPKPVDEVKPEPVPAVLCKGCNAPEAEHDWRALVECSRKWRTSLNVKG